MYAAQTYPELVLIECPDRRTRCRMEHREAVQLDGRLVMGRDISSTGMSVYTRESMSVGAEVRVTLAGTAGESAVVTNARVVHVEKGSRRTIAGLQFIQ